MIDREHPLLLGSASPRRREILTTLGIPLTVRPAVVDERVREGEGADAYLTRVVADKLAAALRDVEAPRAGAVLVADTSVLVDGAILGKPADKAEARAMIGRLAGRGHEVWTRFAVAGPAGRGAIAETVRTRVLFRALSDQEIAAYAATGEGLDKAGGYAIQGIGGFAVERIEGSYANVVGLPSCEVVAALLRAGLLASFPLSTSA
jgi:septum formation protein